jgi:hypothetical protein
VRVVAKLSRREQTALIFCLAFIAATFLLSMIDQNSLFHAVRNRLDPNLLRNGYTGTIVTPEQAAGMCRFVQYDNRTSEFTNTEFGECLSRRFNVNSPNARMNALRDTFKK